MSETVTLPPGYDGNRFRNDIETENCQENDNLPVSEVSPPAALRETVPNVLKNISRDEMLLISLLIVLAGEEKIESDTVLMLALLLFLGGE